MPAGPWQHSTRYVLGVAARVGGATTVLQLLEQRRRWQLDSLLALLYAALHASQLYRSGLPVLRKAALSLRALTS